MRTAQSQERKARQAGFFVVLALHGALLYGLWQSRILPPPAAAATVFVSLLKDPPKPQPPKREPPQPKPQAVKLEKTVQPPPLLVAQAPVVMPAEPVAPPPPPKIAAPTEPVPMPKPTGPVMLSGELAIACPERTPPSYPARARRLGEEGKVVLRVALDETGQVDGASVKTSSGYMRLDEAALIAVKQWHCNPAQRDGVAVRAVAIQAFNFVLEGR